MEFTAQNGAKINIGMASFEAVDALQTAIQKAILSQGIKIPEFDKVENIFDLELSGKVIESILQNIMAINSDAEFKKALFACLDKSTINGIRITKDVFDAKDLADLARGAYYEIMINCVKSALTPFFAPLFSKLGGLQEKIQFLRQNTKPEQTDSK